MYLLQLPGQFIVKKAPPWKAFLAAKGGFKKYLSIHVSYRVTGSETIHETTLKVQVGSITSVSRKYAAFKRQQVILSLMKDDGTLQGARYTFLCRPIPLWPNNRVRVKQLTVTTPHHPR
jgi:hypothetical protein